MGTCLLDQVAFHRATEVAESPGHLGPQVFSFKTPVRMTVVPTGTPNPP